MPAVSSLQFQCLCVLCAALAVVNAQDELLNQTNSTAGEEAAEPAAAEESECAAAAFGSYNLPFRIGGLFIVLVTSFLGIFGTYLLGNGRNSPNVMIALRFAKFFGIGIMASTAWIHLLPEAFASFGSECLTGAWARYGGGFVGVFAMIATFGIQLTEFLTITGSQPRSGIHGHGPSLEMNAARKNYHAHNISSKPSSSPPECEACDSASADDLDDENPRTVSQATVAIAGSTDSASDQEMSVFFLEGGILIHSLIIGITLGVAEELLFDVLLMVITFHQFFEGMGLGAIIASIPLKDASERFTRIAMVVAFPLVTPLGMAIGIGVHSSFNANDPSILISQGVFGSLSAGILFYNTYTELFSSEITHSSEFRKLPEWQIYVSFFFMYLGAAAMAILGIWA